MLTYKTIVPIDTHLVIMQIRYEGYKNDNTHQNGFGYYYLNEDQKTALYQQIANELK